tara:strand:+ start:5099 stop:5305 length:207 start_codon:yes stop_codon:yes gene_type:complete
MIYDPDKLDERLRAQAALERRSTDLFGERHLISADIFEGRLEEACLEISILSNELRQLQKDLHELMME